MPEGQLYHTSNSSGDKILLGNQKKWCNFHRILQTALPCTFIQKFCLEFKNNKKDISLQNSEFCLVAILHRLGICLAILYSKYGYVLSWPDFSQILVKKLQSKAELISDSRSALKTESTHICCIYFWEFLFFCEKMDPHSL